MSQRLRRVSTLVARCAIPQIFPSEELRVFLAKIHGMNGAELAAVCLHLAQPNASANGCNNELRKL